MASEIWRPIRGDLRRILLSVPGIPDIAHEGMPFIPTEGVPWLRERIEKGNSSVATVARGLVEERAIYLLDLNWPRRSAFSEGEDLADKIRIAFRPAREIGSAGSDFIKGRVISANARGAIMFEGWTQFPVRIEFFFRRSIDQA